MGQLFRSVITAGLIAATVYVFTVQVVAPVMPPFVGPADLRESKRLELPAAQRLILENEDGAVSVSASDVADGSVTIAAEILVYFREGADEVSARAYTEGLVHAAAADGAIAVVTEPAARPETLDLRVNYTIRVPRGTDVEVRGANGNVKIGEGCGQVAVYGGNRDIEILRPAGMVIAQSSNGRIRVVDADDGARLDTDNGDIYANVRAGTLEATSVNGHIIARLLEDQVGRCALATQNGSVSVLFAGEPSVVVDAQTERGIIKSDFPVAGEDAGVLRQKQVEGVLGGGAAELTATTLNGNIWLGRNPG